MGASRVFPDLLAFDTSGEEVGLSPSSSSSNAANISTAEGLTQTRVWDFLAIDTSEEEGRELGTHPKSSPEREVTPSLTLASPAGPGPGPELLPLSSEDEAEERILSEDLRSCDISEGTVVVTSDALTGTAGRKVRAEQQSSPALAVTAGQRLSQETAGLLRVTRPSQQEEEEEEGGQIKVSEVSGGPGQSQSSGGEETERPPVSRSGREGGRRLQADLSQAEFLRYFRLCSIQEAEQRR